MRNFFFLHGKYSQKKAKREFLNTCDYLLFIRRCPAAICFYVPRYLWKTWEGGRIKMLVLDLNCPVVNDEAKEERKKILLDYFSENLNRHNFYAFRFFICEALNFVNVFVQIYFMDYFLGGEFSTYGSDVLSFTEMEPEERADPMSRVFPKVTKCTVSSYICKF